MSMLKEEEIKRWTAKRKSALVIEILQDKTTAAEVNHAFIVLYPTHARPCALVKADIP